MQPTFYQYNTQGNLIAISQGLTGSNPEDPAHYLQHRYFKYDALGRLTYERQVEQAGTFSLYDPLTGNSAWSRKLVYDETIGGVTYSGLLTTATDARSINTQFQYDQLNRIYQVSYSDGARQVVVAADLNAENDKLLKTRTTADMLGRPILSEQTEDGANYTIYSRQAYDQMGKITYASNPMRYGASASTDGWTRVTNDILGRPTEVATFGGATQPAASGTSGLWTGSVTTSYLANTVTVTDQNEKSRKSVSDALGRLKEVYEDPNGLNYLTSYDYDVFGNLRHVYQGSQTRIFTYDSLSRLRTAANPESGTITYTYDDNGNLLTKTDARSIVSTYVYDALNRATSRSYSDGTPTVTYSYDSTTISNGKGRLASVSSSVSTYTYSGYDTAGKPLGGAQTLGTRTYAFSYVYDLSGHVTSMTYPSGRTVTNVYDGAGRTTSVAGNLGDGTQRTYSSGIIYSSMGGMSKEQFGTTTPIYNKLFYNSRGQLAEIRESTSYTGPTDTTWDRGAIINHYSSSYCGVCSGQSMTDNNGNLKKQEVYIPNSDTFAQFYTYDALNRLQKVNESKNGAAVNWQQQYVYDRYGNRTIDQTNTWGAGIPKPNFGVDTVTNRLTAPAGSTMSYDSAGNLTNDTFTGEGTRTYDAENRMTGSAGILSAVYSYDGDGHRVSRSVNGVETWQVYGLGGELIAEYPQNGSPASPQKEYGYRNGQLLITAEAASNGGGGSGSQAVTWTNAVGVTVNGNNLTSTGSGWGTAGASSTQTISSGDGYVEFTATETNKYRMLGLSLGDSDQSYQDIDFAFYLVDGGQLHVYEAGAARGLVGYFATGDTLRVAVEGGVVKYKKNGAVLYTSTVAPAYPLLVDTALYSNGSTFSNVVISGGGGGGGGTGSVGWANTVGVSTATNNLTKTATYGWGNAGAVSTQSIASGDGYVEFTASETNNYRMLGLSNGDGDQSYQDIDFAFYLVDGGQLHIYEAGAARGLVGYFATGDTLRVAVEGGVVKYKKNGTVLYTSTVAPAYPLLVDTALYSSGSTLNNVIINSGGGGGSSSAQIHWLVTDQLGTPRMVFDQTGSPANMSRHDYLPFGEEIFAGTGGRTSTQGYGAADNVRQKFTLKERDNETGLDYFGARYYGSTMGRFTTPDPLLSSGKPDDPQTWNRYSYTLNNPLAFVDPTGLFTVGSNVSDDERKKIIEAYNKLNEALGKLKAGSKAYKSIERSLARLGKPGEANGVVVTVGSVKFSGGADTDVNKINKGTVTITFDEKTFSNSSADDDAANLGHEGVHADDAFNLFSQLRKNMGAFAKAWESNDVTYRTEYDAYFASAGVYQALQPNQLRSYGHYVIPTQPGKAEIPVMRFDWRCPRAS